MISARQPFSLNLYAGSAFTRMKGTGLVVCAVQGSPETKLTLARGLAMGLEFKLGSEILRTVVVRDWKEIGTVAGIIALRAALTFLIHWEIKEEERT